jgi:hypothetical protein
MPGEEAPPPFCTTPCGEPLFGRERLNPARKGQCDAHLAMWLLSAMFAKVCVYRTLV